MTDPQLEVAILGATGLVGRAMLRLLEERDLPIARLRLFGSPRAQGRTLAYRGESLPVEPATPPALASADLILSSAGGDVSRALLPAAAEAGAVCIDNTSAFRMRPDVPLVVPEVNGERLDGIAPRRGGAIIANPNCSTIQLVAALKPLHDLAGLRRIVVSTYQSLSGAGRRALETFEEASAALLDGTTEEQPEWRATPAFDVFPRIGDLDAEGHSSEEQKMVHETPKILETPVEVDVTCVRVPVRIGHAESVWVETTAPVSPAEARAALSTAPGLIVHGDAQDPTPRRTAGGPAVHVGRLRASTSSTNALQMWVVADNLLKGAAWNAVQIAERVCANASGERAASTDSPLRSSTQPLSSASPLQS